jgi:uncharacterized protein YjbJ (UPF0337 family)
MLNEQVMEGNWDELRGKIREKWGQLTDADLPQFQGNIDQLVGAIQRRTGESRDMIEHYLEDITEGASTFVGKASDRMRQYVQQAAVSVQGSAQQAFDQARANYAEAEEFVRSRPVASLAVCFGLGMLAGVTTAVMFRSR